MKPLNVAVLYNQKREDNKEQSSAEESNEPPSLIKSGNTDSNICWRSSFKQQQCADMYAEWDSAETILAVKSALEEIHKVTLIEANEDAYNKLVNWRPEIVFNMAEGLNGVSREAQMPAILEFLQIPYTGSDPLTLALCLDKARTKEILCYAKIPTPRFDVFTSANGIKNKTIRFPVIVKPLYEGSSKGIYNSSLVYNRSELCNEVERITNTYLQPALIEEFMPGREFTVAIIGNDDDTTVLPVVEIKFESLPNNVNPIYSYEAKWIWDQPNSPLEIFECPAKIDETLLKEIESICIKAYKVLRCKDWCRIDLRLDVNGKPRILELNPLPGILPKPENNSCFPKAAAAAKISYNRLIQIIVALAARRYGLYQTTQSTYQNN